MLELSSKRYFTTACVSLLGLLVFVFLINCLVDPLWHFRGNLVTGQNFPFNERLAKMNLFLQRPDRYDCLILGSSRTRLLNATEIEGHRCFNYSFGGGKIGEFVAHAAYLKKQGFRPELVIVGVDGYNFFTDDVAENISDFVVDSTRPPSFWINYLTVDALWFTVRTLLGQSPSPEYYRSDFSPDTLANVPPYEPETRGFKRPESVESKEAYPERSKWYERMTQVYSHANFVFYVPPISVWRVVEFAKYGILNDYIRGIYSVAQLAPVLYDFSIASNITADVSRTYDGSHYDDRTNALVAETINSGDPKFGVDVKTMSYDDYRTQYWDKLEGFASFATRQRARH